MFKKIINYIKESYDELMNKVSWPSWSELQSSALVVSIASLIIAVVIFLFDMAFGIHGSLNKEDPTAASTVWRGILGFYYWFFS